MRRQWFSFRREGKGQLAIYLGPPEPLLLCLPPEAELEAQPRPRSRQPLHSQGTPERGISPWLISCFGAPHTAPHPPLFLPLQFTRPNPQTLQGWETPTPRSQLPLPRGRVLSCKRGWDSLTTNSNHHVMALSGTCQTPPHPRKGQATRSPEPPHSLTPESRSTRPHKQLSPKDHQPGSAPRPHHLTGNASGRHPMPHKVSL